MTMTMRFLSPATGAASRTGPDGATWNMSPGRVLDFDPNMADLMRQYGWHPIGFSGGTTDRPAASDTGPNYVKRGTQFFDISVGKILIFDGATWRDPATGAAA